MGDWNFDNPPECLPEEMMPFHEEQQDNAVNNDIAFKMPEGWCIQVMHYG